MPDKIRIVETHDRVRLIWFNRSDPVNAFNGETMEFSFPSPIKKRA